MFGPEGSNVPSTRPRIHRDRGLLVQGLLAAGLGALCLLWPASAEWLRPIGSLAVLLGVVLLVVHVLVCPPPGPRRIIDAAASVRLRPAERVASGGKNPKARAAGPARPTGHALTRLAGLARDARAATRRTTLPGQCPQQSEETP